MAPPKAKPETAGFMLNVFFHRLARAALTGILMTCQADLSLFTAMVVR